MKFVVQQKILSEALSIVGRVVNSKNALVPILDNFRFEIFGGQCKITGGNGSMFISKMIELSQDADEVDICIEGFELKEYLRTLDEQQLTFEVERDDKGMIIGVELKCPTGDCRFLAESGDNYLMMSAGGDVDYDLDGHLFMDSMSRAKEFVNPNDARVIKHVLVEMGNGIRVVGTDANKLMYRAITDNTVNLANLLISKNDAAILSAIDTQEKINLSYDKSNMVLDMGNGIRVAVRLQVEEKQYPAYMGLIPSDFATQVSVDVSALKKSLKRSKIFDKLVTLNLSPKGILNLSSVNMDTGRRSSEELQCECTGAEYANKFTTEYLISVLDNVKSQNVLLFLTDSKMSPIVILEEGTPSEQFVMILMPIGQP